MPAPTGCQRALGGLEVLVAALGSGWYSLRDPSSQNVRGAPLQHGLPEQEANGHPVLQRPGGSVPPWGSRVTQCHQELDCASAVPHGQHHGGISGRADITAVLWENPDDPSTKNVVSPTSESQDSLHGPSP